MTVQTFVRLSSSVPIMEEFATIQELSQYACEVTCLPAHDLLTGHVKNGICRGLPFY